MNAYSPRDRRATIQLRSAVSESAMLRALPTWTTEASIYQSSRFSYYSPPAGLSATQGQSLGPLGRSVPLAGIHQQQAAPALNTAPGGGGRCIWSCGPPISGTCLQYCFSTCNPVGGGYQSTCHYGMACCGRTKCVNLSSDPNNCGQCGRVCPKGENCSNYTCSLCPSGQTDCGGVCVGTGSDQNNCGGCGIVCPPGTACCGGFCVDISSDPNNCGGCGVTCSRGVNNNPPACCGGMCTDTSSDPSNCGGCGKTCPSGVICCNSGCGGTDCGNGICCPPPFSHCGGPFTCW
jgi:Stigma-specific protein, Stig1